jgi:hypothetical protein
MSNSFSVNFTNSSPKLSNPRGIDVDMEGNIYIVGLSSNNIHQITSEGKHIRTISTTDFGISEPWVLRFKPNSAIQTLLKVMFKNITLTQ